MIIPRPARLEHTGGLGSAAGREPDLELLPFGPPEGYRIDTTWAAPRIRAQDAAGVAYALTTLGQLPVVGGRLPAVVIEDRPRYPWRGMMLDVARHFHPVETVLALIDEIAALKLNRLHLHLTDDQGWRIQIDAWPRLTEIGASTQVGGGLGAPAFYTKDDFRRIVEHAAERHIVVVPEIDLPGHTNAALTAYPELAVPGVDPRPYAGIEVGFSTLDTRNELTYRFVEDVIGEVAAMTPGPWLHLGGDESLATEEADYLEFIRRVTAIGARTGKQLIGWHEMGRSRELPPGTIGQYWNLTTPEPPHDEHLRSFLEQDGWAILSPGDVAYLDMQRWDGDRWGLSWANGPTSLREAYSWDPAAIVPGVGEDRILGIEAPMFTETIDTLEAIRQMAFPRLAALAELMWSAADGHDFADFEARLAASPWAGYERRS